jgi:hypothetical protein
MDFLSSLRLILTLTGLGNVTLASCSFQTGVRYCGKLFFGARPLALEPQSDLPIRVITTKHDSMFFTYKGCRMAQ